MVFLLSTITYIPYTNQALAAQPSIEPLGVKQPVKNSGINVSPDCNPDPLLGRTLESAVKIFFLIGSVAVLIMFLWGSVSWILSGGDKEKVAGARKRITTAIVGIAMLSLTFISIYTLGTMIGINPLDNLEIPTFSGQQNGVNCNPTTFRDPNS